MDAFADLSPNFEISLSLAANKSGKGDSFLATRRAVVKKLLIAPPRDWVSRAEVVEGRDGWAKVLAGHSKYRRIRAQKYGRRVAISLKLFLLYRIPPV